MKVKGIVVCLILCLALLATGFYFRRPPLKENGRAVLVNELLAKAAGFAQNGNKVEEKAVYSQILSEHPDYDNIKDIQMKLGKVNLSIINSNYPSPQKIVHEVLPGESLGKLAKQYKTTINLIKEMNDLKSDVVRVGQKLSIWTAPFNVAIDKSQNILYLKSGEEILKIYRVSTGMNNSTPVGIFKIAVKIVSPVWYKAGGAPIPSESPENQLGSRWMGFAEDPSYGIHGTREPEKIGQSVSNGCIRMLNPEVEELFDLLPEGAEVKIVD